MRRGSKSLIVYFLFFGALSVIALIPGGALAALLITGMMLPLFGMPGFLVIASPTIFIYSAALIPLWLALTAPQRRIWRITVAALVPIVVAVAPSLLSQLEARQFAVRMGQNDMSRSADAKPRSVELSGDATSGLFVPEQIVGDKNAACNEVCRRLLFNGEVDWVRMTRTPRIYMGKNLDQTWSATYRIEQRNSCPQLYPDGTHIEKAVRDRLISGDCLITRTDDNATPDARVTFTTKYFNQRYPPDSLDDGPAHAIIETVKGLRIESRQGEALIAIMQQTETVAHTLALPFYIGTEMHMQGGYNGPTIGRDKIVIKPIDIAQALRDAFGYGIAEISAPPLEDPQKVAERILALPLAGAPVLSAQQQDVLTDVLAAMAKQSALSDIDVEFVRRVITDNRITEPRLGVVLQNMFRKYAGRLEPLIPVVLDRISTPVPEQAGHYQSHLGWSLMNFPADSLRPYRDKMVTIVDAQADWPSAGVLTRLAELGGEQAVNLVIRRLDSKSVSQFAAIAACRASAEAWPALKPAVLAHLMQPRRGNHLHDDERPLLLALVRFGEKPFVEDMIEKRGLFDKTRMLERLAKFEQGFAPERCRDHL